MRATDQCRHQMTAIASTSQPSRLSERCHADERGSRRLLPEELLSDPRQLGAMTNVYQLRVQFHDVCESATCSLHLRLYRGIRCARLRGEVARVPYLPAVVVIYLTRQKHH